MDAGRCALSSRLEPDPAIIPDSGLSTPGRRRRFCLNGGVASRELETVATVESKIVPNQEHRTYLLGNMLMHTSSPLRYLLLAAFAWSSAAAAAQPTVVGWIEPVILGNEGLVIPA
jgi:hypothetical protein